MINDDFKKILSRAEGETLDFKEQAYDLKVDRNKFIKDVLSMTNTPRDIDSYIVLGVQWTPEEGSKVIGLDAQYDDVMFQNAVGEGRVQPRPVFEYLPFQYQSKNVGVIRVPEIGRASCRERV